MVISSKLKAAAYWLLIVGGINWGLVGLGNILGMGDLNLVEKLLASLKGVSDWVYVLVGLSALYTLWGKVNK